MAMLLTNGILLVYVLLFIGLCLRYRLISWLVVSVLFWLIFAIVGNILLPGLSGLFKLTNLYLIPLYICLGSFFKRRSHLVSFDSSYLSTLSISGRMQLSSLFVWMILVFYLCKWMPIQIPIISRLIQMCLWQPVFWVGSQWLLMSLLYINRHASKPKSHLQELFLLTMFWQIFYAFLSLKGVI